MSYPACGIKVRLEHQGDVCEFTNLALVKISTTPSSPETVQPSHFIKPAIMLKAFKKDPVSAEVLEAWKRIILKCIGRRMREM
jgi:hypothetical protein